MSQPNNIYPPTFNYSEDYSDSSSFPIGNAAFSAWNQHGPRAMGNTAPSPSPSTRSSRTAPNPRTASVSWVQSIPSNSATDPALSNGSLLVPPQVSRPRAGLDTVGNISPLDRFYNHDAPWSSQNQRTSSMAFARPYTSQSGMSHDMREGPGSDIASITCRSDSGYRSYYAHSGMSNDPEHVEDLPPEMTQLVGNLNVSASNEPMDMFPIASTDQTSQYSGRSTNQGKAEFTCEQCHEKSKCKSDHKKHMLKHVKPFKCDIHSCKRGDKGFTTDNDLMRHKKSVHRIGMLKNSYQCASPSCRNRGKIWPRLDNFKQHIHRMHREENENDLIQNSVFQERPEPSPSSHSMSVAPMDTTLAGIGTDKQFSGNEFDDPVSGISLTPDQDFHRWTTSDPTSHEFSIDVDQSNQDNVNNDSRKDSAYHVQDRLAPYDLSMSKARRNSNLERLDTLAAIASSQSTGKTTPLLPPRLSSAPQTKADQQRQALQKLSKIVIKDIKNSSNVENLDLQDVFMRALAGATNPGQKDSSSQSAHESPMSRSSSSDSHQSVLTKGEALKASQAISVLIKQSSKPSHTRARSSPTKGFFANKVTCPHCPTTLARSCDMRKHMKRHTKPYGCTYPKCHKRFGAKSDWKRHENSQHFQLESFRCRIPSSTSKAPCGDLSHRTELFLAHLKSQHHVQDSEVLALEVKTCRIGKNGQGQFWCGFCETVVKLEKKRNAAWDERFDHIDRHFCKEKKGIEEWLCVEAKKKKGDVAREVDKDRFDDEDEDGEFAYEVHPESDDRGHGEETQEQSRQGEASQTCIQRPTDSIHTSQVSNLNPRKRHAEPSHLAISPVSSSSFSAPPPPPKRARKDREVVRYCCSCQSGPWAQHTFVDCMICNHHLCSTCTIVGVDEY